MTKEQYIEQYLDKYEQEHPDEKLDYDALREQADCEWYDLQVDHGEATEYDLTAEQEKVAKDAMKGMARAVNAYGKEVKRVRKENHDKRFIISVLYEAMQATGEHAPLGDGGKVINPERQIDFNLNGVDYSITLTAHRPPKK